MNKQYNKLRLQIFVVINKDLKFPRSRLIQSKFIICLGLSIFHYLNNTKSNNCGKFVLTTTKRDFENTLTEGNAGNTNILYVVLNQMNGI